MRLRRAVTTPTMNVVTAATTPIAANSMNIAFPITIAMTTAPHAVTPVPINPVNEGRWGSAGDTGATTVGAQHPEPDVGPSARQRERPGVAGQQILLEPHDELGRRCSCDTGEVLPEGVPFAAVSLDAETGGLADRAPHPVRRDHRARPDPAETLDVDIDMVGAPDHPGDRTPLADLGTLRPGQVEQCRIEVEAWRDGGELAVGGQGHLEEPPPR